jgi:hypothetical protein
MTKPQILLNKKSLAGNTILYIIIVLVSVTVWLFCFKSGHLHDASHYLTAGICYLRDRNNLVYPYDVGGNISSYNEFTTHPYIQSHRVIYPSFLYSILIAFPALITNVVSLEGSAFFTLICLVVALMLFWFFIRKNFGIFQGGLSLLLILTAPPVINSISHGNDITSILGLAVILVFPYIKLNYKDYLIGFTLTLFILLRPANITLVPISLMMCSVLDKEWKWNKNGIKVIMSVVLTYISLAKVFSFLVQPVNSESNPIQFYIRHYNSSFYNLKDIQLICQKALTNLSDMVKPTSLFIWPFIGIYIILFSNRTKAKVFSLAAFLWCIVPFTIYSLDRYSGPHVRYYVCAAPLFIISTVFFIIESKKYKRYVKFWCALSSLTIIAVTLLTNQFTSGDSYKSRYYPAFVKSQNICAKFFNHKSKVLSNHALSTALYPFETVIGLPLKNDFILHDNKNIDGIILFNSTAPPDSFFNNKSWLTNSFAPQLLEDNYANKFSLVCTEVTSIYIKEKPTRETIIYIYAIDKTR